MAKSKATITNADIAVTHGSGNVFADLGFDDAEELQVKAGLTHQIAHRIHALGLTQKQAVARLGISQPDVSKLMQGRYTGFSTDRLLALLNALDVDIDIILRPCNEHVAAHRVRVRFLRPRRPRLPRVTGTRSVVQRRSVGKKRTGALA